VAAALREACNGERNNAPTLKMEKWNGDANGHVGLVAEHLSSRLGFSCDGENTIATSTVNPLVIEVLNVGFLHQEASLSVQPAVEVKHSCFYCYGSESDNSDKSICSSASSIYVEVFLA
jgi:hypothetical protein